MSKEIKMAIPIIEKYMWNAYEKAMLPKIMTIATGTPYEWNIYV